jgi:2-phosphosulfolactate phosphatase
LKTLQVFPTWQSVVPGELHNKIAVVIDVLRATNTIITSLKNGAREIIPVSEIETAWELKNNNPSYLLGGERNSQKISGFDLGNSPLEYTRQIVNEKTIILATSNGSKALKTAEPAKDIFIASLANSKAVAHLLATTGLDITIICAGTLGSPSLEDTLAAGSIISEMKTFEQYQLNDYAYIALGSFTSYKWDIFNVILQSRNGRRLEELGMVSDIKPCSLLNNTDLVPLYKHSKITAN